jgi:hypothetical protein
VIEREHVVVGCGRIEVRAHGTRPRTAQELAFESSDLESHRTMRGDEKRRPGQEREPRRDAYLIRHDQSPEESHDSITLGKPNYS